MRLADFILHDMEAVLTEWDSFAAEQLPAAATMKKRALRDHARQILEAIATDIARWQSLESQEQKSKGLAPEQVNAPETAAQTHALLRARSGFDINQMAAEYRALRASVLRLWAEASGPAGTDLRDTIRFNEAIDQALAESIAFFSAEVDEARNLLLGMLGHDMRNPLQAIQMTALYLSKIDAGPEVASASHRLLGSSARLKEMLDDLLDFNRAKLGLGIEITPTQIDLRQVFEEELQLLRAAHPQREIDFSVTGKAEGIWDAGRLRQVLGNLVTNAFKYGAPEAPVRVALEGGAGDELVFHVRNTGKMIPAADLGTIFNPLTRGLDAQTSEETGLGLGLFICREIAQAHGGGIAVQSDASSTTFEVRLPKNTALDDSK